ncbi:MAG: hypothetical protein JOZ69_00540 [Myxococcales bacterium]|nr:hypothetical protein [Myxococcales bacterium]
MDVTTHLGPSADLSGLQVAAAFALALASFALLLLEMRRRERGGAVIAVSGLLAVAALLVAVLRPARVSARESRVGARIVVLADTSRSMALADGDKPRHVARDAAIARLRASAPESRFAVLGFGEGAPAPLLEGAGEASARAGRSDLLSAVRAVAASPDEHPGAVVVVSDGRLDDPPEDSSPAALRAVSDALHAPVSAIATTRDAPPDASVRRVVTAGAAVAHVALPVGVEVGCAGGLSCDEIPVTARELRDDGPPALLASGVAHVRDGKATLDLPITLDRAGSRIVEFAIAAQPGDKVPENDRRLITFHVTRERVRVLHVAGRPTNDVRALRRWIKADASVDVVAFFILRTPNDDVHAAPNDLALIPFPVDELFQEHLPSFDAIVLQDFDAQPYGLEKYLENIRRYVRRGGGLVMVGGENSFVAGGYAGTPLADVLPVKLDGLTNADTSPFVPVWTPAGASSPLLAPLRLATGERIPEMPGANVLGDVRPGGVALWTHPTRTTASGAPMPVLAIGEEGDGRTVALGVDGTWEFEFSALGADTVGRGHGALWDGLLGWLMRDPRFEPAQIQLVGTCTAGLASTLRVRLPTLSLGEAPGVVALEVTRIDRAEAPIALQQARPTGQDSLDLALPPLPAGGYTARLRAGSGIVTRHDFACEGGGDEWADSRPDPGRLEALAKASGGDFAWASDPGRIRLPRATVVSAERHVTPLAPAWTWTVAATLLLGAHWVARRRGGLS